MSRCEIVPCTMGHLPVLARTMRAEDRAEIEGMGLNVRHFLVSLYRQSDYKRTLLIDGEVAACGGDQAPTMMTEGWGWLLTTPLVERLPFAFMREVRRETEKRLRFRSVLRADTSAGYIKAQRFFQMIGFEVLPVGSDGSPKRREIRIGR